MRLSNEKPNAHMSPEGAERYDTYVSDEPTGISEEMEDIKKVLWSIEEVLYMNTVDDVIFNVKKKEILEKLNSVVHSAMCHSQDLKPKEERIKRALEIVKEYDDFFEALQLVKSVDYENCINHKALFPFFHFLMNLLRNKNFNTVQEVGKEIFNYVLQERNKNYGCESIFISHLLVSCLLQYKLLLCAITFLNIFIQHNCTGPIFDLEESGESELIEDEVEKEKGNKICLKTFLRLLYEMNGSYSSSCFEMLSLEGEYVYHGCQFLNCFCMTIVLLDIINNYEKDNFSFFEEHETHFCKKYEERGSLKESYFFSKVLQTYSSEKGVSLHNIWDILSLYHLKSRFLWIARVYFIWQRLFTSNSIYYHFLRVHVLEKPLTILSYLKIVPDTIRPKDLKECENLEEYVPIVNDFSKMIPQFGKLFFNHSLSTDFQIYVLCNYSMYLAYYNDVHAHNIVTEEIATFSNFHWTFTGRMGIRRKYQKNPVSLLVLKTSSDGIEDETDSVYVDVCPSSIYDILKSNNSILDIERDEKKTFTETTTVSTDTSQQTSNGTEESNKTNENDGTCNSVSSNTNFGIRKTWKLADLDPDTDILEEPFFVDSQNNRFRVLNFKEQIILINKCYSYTQFFPEYDPITFEEMSALISRCLKSYDVNLKEMHKGNMKSNIEQDSEKINGKEGKKIVTTAESLQRRFQNWLLHSSLLLFKSRVEFTRYRTRDRANTQLNELIKEYTAKEPNGSERMRFAYDVYYPFHWYLKKQVGKRMVDSGNMMTAFHLYKSLKLWEDAVNCLIAVGRNGEAIELLDEISQGNRTPCIVCLYGMADTKNNYKFFEESWKLSNGKYAKAARLLGTHYYNANDYKKCCYYFEKALEISPLYPDIYFMLGCAYMKRQEYTEAIKAFTRMVSMPNAECHKAWGNLAFIYINLNKFESAQICITHAIKLDFNNWKYWDTYMKVAVCQQDIDNSCLALKELCELGKAKFIDPVVFRLFLNVVLNRDLIEATGREEYVNKIMKTMKLVSDYMGVNTEFWKIYFVLTAELGDHDEALNLCVRSLRSVQSTLENVNVVETRKELLKQHCTDIVFVCTDMLKNVMNIKERLQLLDKLSSVVYEYFPRVSYQNEPFLKCIEEMKRSVENMKIEQTVSE